MLARVRRIKDNEVHFTLDDCLEICEEYKQVEACAILKNKMTNYFSSVADYIHILTSRDHCDSPKLVW